VLNGGTVTRTKTNYTGQKLDDTGLLYYHARLYEPAVALVIKESTMKIDKDLWFGTAVLVSVLAIVAWSFEAITNIGGAWVPWIAGIVIVVALGSIAAREWLKNRNVVWTEEMKALQKRRSKQQALESIPTIALGLSSFVPISLVRAEVLPQWAGGLLFFALLAGTIWMWWALHRSKASKRSD
jgi:hypothetical protein